MTIRNKEQYSNPILQRMVRKRDQAWDMAGLARQDHDKPDEIRRTKEARDWERQIKEYIYGI